MTFENVKATLEAAVSDGSPEIAEYIKGLDWDPTPVVLTRGERRVELFCQSEPPCYPGFTGYHGFVQDDSGKEKWISGEWEEVSRDVLEYLDTGTLPEPSTHWLEPRER